ncbi:flavoprotein [Micromonospora sp. CPCC 205539]|uniref:flavoprotein n=1 Tax=Micromonospora sp. CPCC 205539 TaxID=3122408 RepID=UPI002FF06B94
MSKRPVLALVVSAAPPVLRINELIDLLIGDGWRVCVTATPTAATWINQDALARQTGYPVRVEWRLPGDPEPHPAADATVVVPATFNVINKWALGINDNVALGILNQALGSRLPVYAFPNVKAELAAHPAYEVNLRQLAASGVAIKPLGFDADWLLVAGRLSRQEVLG